MTLNSYLGSSALIFSICQKDNANSEWFVKIKGDKTIKIQVQGKKNVIPVTSECWFLVPLPLLLLGLVHHNFSNID